MKTHYEDTADQIHGPYRWRSFAPGDLNVTDGTAQEAADAMQLDVTEVEWACEEYGRCDTQFPSEPGFGVVCWCPGEPVEGNDGELIAGGYEWPVTEAPIDPAEDHAEFLRQHKKD